jgi:transglutaminase-like putative cysteine protease
LIDRKGNITNLFVPGLVKDSKFTIHDAKTNTDTQMIYNASLTVPATAPQASYLQPALFTVKTESGVRTYSITGQNLLGKTGWIQLGIKQLTYFKLVQKADKTDFVTPTSISNISNLISTNIYKIALPREFDETNQTTLYKQMTPEPTKIERDSEGNLIATFEVPANQDSTITIEGYIELSKDQKLTIPTIKLDAYNTAITSANMQKYLTPDKYWQSTDPYITDIAATLKKEKTTVNQLLEASYQYVIDHLTYSHAKVNGDNPRLGAIAALQGGQGVCMEYADSLIAILRAQGIPARPAFGYGNDPTIDNTADSFSVKRTVNSTTIGHQWVQIWLPNYGWLSVDPTWGETGRMYIGGDLDHVLWYTAADLTDPVYDSLLYSADLKEKSILDNFELTLTPIAEGQFPGADSLKTLDSLVTTKIVDAADPNITNLDFAIKTSPLGRTFIVVTPVCLALLVLLFVLTSISNLIKRNRYNKAYVAAVKTNIATQRASANASTISTQPAPLSSTQTAYPNALPADPAQVAP